MHTIPDTHAIHTIPTLHRKHSIPILVTILTIHTIHTAISNIPYPTDLHTILTIHTITTIHAIHSIPTMHTKHTILSRHAIPDRPYTPYIPNIPYHTPTTPQGEGDSTTPPVIYFVLRVYTMLSCMLTCTLNSLFPLRHFAGSRLLHCRVEKSAAASV